MSDSRLLIEFCMFWVQNVFLMKFLDVSAWFCLEKLKKHGLRTKNLKNKARIF